MSSIDWIIVGGYCIFMLCFGWYFMKRAGRSMEDYFIAGRSLPWWVLGFSAVATYSCAGAAPAFTMLVYNGGLLGNWWWWMPWIIWMPLVAVIWSKFWRRLKLVTTAEFIEVRYRGKAASVFRGIYAILMSFGWAVVLMGYVTAWVVRAMCPILGWTPLQLILFCGVITLIYSTAAGLFGAAYSDVPQFGIFFIGNLIFVFIILQAVGGLHVVHDKVHLLRGASFFKAIPPGGDLAGITLFALFIQGLFFAASPAAGEGFTAQRFMAAKNEFHAQVGQMFNAVLSLVIRIIPFLFLGIIGAALYAKGSVDPAEIWGLLVSKYSVVGLTGLLVAAELAAYMSTIDTEMNWGASYLVNDLYRRFIKKDASQKHYVWVSRISTMFMLVLALLIAYFLVKGMMAWFLFINSVIVAFMLPLSWLRFFWWRLNIYGEAAAMIGGIPLGYLIWFPFGFSQKPFWQGFLLLFVAGWVTILLVTFLTRPEEQKTLKEFYAKCKPPGWWGPVTREFSETESIKKREDTKRDIADCTLGILFCGALVVCVNSLVAINFILAVSAGILASIAGFIFIRRWKIRGIFKSL